MVVGGRPGDLRHADEQSISAGPHRGRGLCRGIGPPEQRALVALDRLLPPHRRPGHCDQGRDRDPLRSARRAGTRALRFPAGPPPVMGRRGEHRWRGHAGVHPHRVRGGIADRRDPAVLRRRQLARQPLPTSPFAPRRALRDGGRRHGGTVLHSGTGPIDRDRAPGPPPARHPDQRPARHARRGGSRLGERAGPVAPARHEHGRPGLRTAHLGRRRGRVGWPAAPPSSGCCWWRSGSTASSIRGPSSDWASPSWRSPRSCAVSASPWAGDERRARATAPTPGDDRNGSWRVPDWWRWWPWRSPAPSTCRVSPSRSHPWRSRASHCCRSWES